MLCMLNIMITHKLGTGQSTAQVLSNVTACVCPETLSSMIYTGIVGYIGYIRFMVTHSMICTGNAMRTWQCHVGNDHVSLANQVLASAGF